ncbi:MAG: helix-turn-helix domain-containing protein [Armatimonadota bacterium]
MTHTIRHHSERGTWELARREPDPALRLHVCEYEGYVETTAQPVRRREIPSSKVVVIVNLGSPFRVIDPRDTTISTQYRDSFVAGLDDSYSIVESGGAAYCVQLNFTPIGARMFFGVPMSSLAQRVVGLEDILGPMGHRLADQMHEAPDWEARFAILDSVIADRLARARAAPSGVEWAWTQIQDAGGRIDIGALAAELGWSHKHLIAHFHEQIGLPPKTVARLARFQRAMDFLEPRDDVNWAEIAHHCGYYDQAHLIKDFHQFAGSTPREFLRRRLPDGSGVIDD